MQRQRKIELVTNLLCASRWMARRNYRRVGYHLFHASLALIP
jgi:hypothetical protein